MLSQPNLAKLESYLPFWQYYQANRCIPPINMPTLEAIAVIYQEELHPAPVRLYCHVCVEEMITTLFYQYERDKKELEKPLETHSQNPNQPFNQNEPENNQNDQSNAQSLAPHQPRAGKPGTQQQNQTRPKYRGSKKQNRRK